MIKVNATRVRKGVSGGEARNLPLWVLGVISSGDTAVIWPLQALDSSPAAWVVQSPHFQGCPGS